MFNGPEHLRMESGRTRQRFSFRCIGIVLNVYAFDLGLQSERVTQPELALNGPSQRVLSGGQRLEEVQSSNQDGMVNGRPAQDAGEQVHVILHDNFSEELNRKCA